jgi:ketosteroid isomerase-like protein
MAFPTLLLSMSMMSAQQLVHKLFDSFNRHDIAALQALYAPNAHLTSTLCW